MIFSGLYSASEFPVSSLQFCKLQAKGSQKGNTQVKLIQFLFSCKSIQKYLSLLFSCAIFGQHTEVDWHCILSHSAPVTPLQHWQFSSPCSLWVFSGEKQILLFGNTCFPFLSFSFCHISVMSSFKYCLENGNRLVIARKKKTKTNSELHLWRRFSPAAFCFGCWSHIHGRQWGDSHCLQQNSKEFYGRYFGSIFGDVCDTEK